MFFQSRYFPPCFSFCAKFLPQCQLSVMIRIPPSFPLKNVEVDCQKTLGIPENRWRRWALQIMLMLNNQDGSVLDALLLWKQNVDKEFDGIEPCPVCYSVLCIKTHAMPNLQCRTCNNRFHSTCPVLYLVHSRGQGLRCSIDDLYEQFVVPIDEIQPKKYNWGKRQIRHTDEVIEWTSPNKRAQSDH
mmetsp:Transcript_14614/g.30623  ORF Transcript_14614/g.30623 Transcript_14614/m.30623 type:complete len:187 (-) Transcript_14614:2803-3363(-)